MSVCVCVCVCVCVSVCVCGCALAPDFGVPALSLPLPAVLSSASPHSETIGPAGRGTVTGKHAQARSG